MLALSLYLGARLLTPVLSAWPALRDETLLAMLAAIGMITYGGMVAVLFGSEWLALLRRRTPGADA